ncbi:MAG: hypothetical protein U9R42_12335 [Bacteroidota bacterium]|nr:hypothetical protein [Bacteroidota bacterium]
MSKSKKNTNKQKEQDTSNKNELVKDDELKTNKIESDGIIPDEILETIPIEERGKVVSIIKKSMISSVSKRTNPIAEKITPEHITTLIENSSVVDKRDRTERKSERNYNLILIIIGLVFVSFLVIFLQKNINLLITIITAILSFIGGFGFGKSQKNKD